MKDKTRKIFIWVAVIILMIFIMLGIHFSGSAYTRKIFKDCEVKNWEGKLYRLFGEIDCVYIKELKDSDLLTPGANK